MEVIPTLTEIAGRLPEKLIRNSLYRDGGFCPLGFILHELGVSVEALDCFGTILASEYIPESLRREGDNQVGYVAVPEILNRAYPAVPIDQFYDIMRLNDLNYEDDSRAGMVREALRQLSRTGKLGQWSTRGCVTEWTE